VGQPQSPRLPQGEAAPSATVLVLVLLAAAVPRPAAGWSVLVLGGTGFRGHPTTEYLARTGHNVTVVSRGNSYWGILEQLQNASVAHWRCNRTLTVGRDGLPNATGSGLALCAPLVESAAHFDAVVDFSSRSSDELKQVVRILRGRIAFYVFMSSHAVYSVAKNATHGEPTLFETDAVRPGREISPLERYELKGKSKSGNNALECEEELEKQYNSGGFPYTSLRLTNVVGPKENTIRYWLLHLWIRAHLALTLPMHLDTTMLETPISLTYTLDIARAVVRAISKARNEICCPEDVEDAAFNLACEEAPTQRTLYNFVAEPMGMPYVETIEMDYNKSIVLYPEIVRGPVSISKASDALQWSPTDLTKALRSVARFYDRTMMDERKYKRERGLMYRKVKNMLGADGPRFVEWTRAYYAERRKNELYDELDDEDEDEIVMVREPPRRARRRRARRKKIDL